MLLDKTASVYDRLHEFWENPDVPRRIALLLTLAFLCTGAAIALNRLGLLPAPLDALVPLTPFSAIRLAFAMILAVEVVELIVAISDSLSRAVAKQMEIMALILLRESFTDISLLGTQISLEHDGLVLLEIGATAVGGLLLFVFRGLFSRWYKGLAFNDKILSYINAKKCVSLFLFLVFLGAGAYDLYGMGVLGRKSVFFELFYTALIFTDILLVLVSQYFMPCFHATFRNSGYAVGTLIMRIALASPHWLGALLCVFAGLYLLALTYAAARFMPKGRR